MTVIIAAPSGLGALGISIGSVAAAVDLISRMFAPIEAIAVEFQTIQEALSGLERIHFDKEEEYREELKLEKNFRSFTYFCRKH